MGFEPATFRFLSIDHISFVPSPKRAKSNALYGHVVETMLSYRPMQPIALDQPTFIKGFLERSRQANSKPALLCKH